MDDKITFEEAKERLNWYEKKYGPYIKKRGVHNIKNLFRWPTLQEWIVLIMLILVLFMAWAYNNDTRECRGFFNNLDRNINEICENNRGLNASGSQDQILSIGGLNITLEET